MVDVQFRGEAKAETQPSMHGTMQEAKAQDEGHIEKSRLQLQKLSLSVGVPVGPKLGGRPVPFLFSANAANTSNYATSFNAAPAHKHTLISTPNQRFVTVLQRHPSARSRSTAPGAYFAQAADARQAHIELRGSELGGLSDSNWAFADIDWVMADVDGRGDYDRRGGGGYGGRKRRYREDDEPDRRYNDRRPTYDRRPYPQHRSHEEPMSVRVRKQILTIAESPLRNPEEDVAAIAKNIIDNYDDEYFRNHITNTIVQLVTEQPFKIPFVAAIVLHANQHKEEVGELVLEKSGSRTQAALESGDWRSFKLLLRFLGCLQSLFEGEGVFVLLEELFNKAADLQSASTEDALGLELVKIIMLTIPYILASPATDVQQPAAELLNKTDIIASALREIETILDPYVAVGDQDAPRSQSVIGLLQKQLQGEADGDWVLSFIPRLYKPSEDVVDTDESSSSSKHVFPAVSVPQMINPGPRPLFPELYFSLYADQDVETVPPTSSLAASLFRDTLVDTINILDFNRNAAAKYLIDIDCYWAPETFVKRATPFDKVKDAAGTKSTWKPEDLVVDAIFSQMLQLPAPQHKLVYYHSMITETCKIAAGSIAPSLGRAIRYLYKNILVMDVELGYRFLDWFAHHLSNFDFRWKWAEWIDDVERTNLHPRKAFILGAIDKEIRLSFAKRVRDTLPEPYHTLIPSSKDNDIPEFKYNNELTPHSAEAKQIVGLLKRKAPESDIQPVVDSIHASETTTTTDADPILASTDAYVTALCYIGSKSLSHVLSYIERCKERLITLGAASPAARAQIISAVVAYWRDVQPGVAVNIVDKLLNYTILTPTGVVEWALSPERLDGGRALAETWVYEMVERTVGKVTGRVRQIVAARMQAGLPAGQVEVLEKALAEEVQGMRALFAVVDDALAGVAEGTDDTMLERGDGVGGADEGEMALLRAWGVKWRRVFARKLAVEETVVGEAARLFPPAAEEVVEVEVEIEHGPDGNGVGNGAAGAADGDADMDEIL